MIIEGVRSGRYGLRTSLVKIAVMETIDYGTEDAKCWMLDAWEGNGYSTEKTNAERERFVEAVISRLRGTTT